jgi:hypothetical protein
LDRKRSFIIVIGTTSTEFLHYHRDVMSRHWILPALESDYEILPLQAHQKYLHMLCDRAASFAIKDYYENTTKRVDSSKTLRLPSGEIVSASFQPIVGPAAYKTLTFKFERPDSSAEPIADQDYFHLDQIQPSLRHPGQSGY